MNEDILLPFDLLAVRRKKVSAAFDGGQITSDGGVMLFAAAEFNTIRLRLLKLGARVIEMASRVRLAYAAACPDAALIRHVAAALMPKGP